MFVVYDEWRGAVRGVLVLTGLTQTVHRAVEAMAAGGSMDVEPNATALPTNKPS